MLGLQAGVQAGVLEATFGWEFGTIGIASSAGDKILGSGEGSGACKCDKGCPKFYE